MSLVVTLDAPEPRIRRSAMRGLDYGKTWDLYGMAGVSIDEPTRTVILAPLPLTEAWNTTVTGDYARLRKANFSMSGGALSPVYWTEREVGNAGNWFVESVGTVLSAGTVFTTQNFDANCGMAVTFYAPNWGVDKGTAINFGFKGPNESTWFRVMNDGQCYVFSGTAFLAAHSLSDKTRVEAVEERLDDLETRFGEASNEGFVPSGYSMGNQFHSVIVIPRPDREVIVTSPTAGGCFTVTIDTLAPANGDTTPRTITDDGPMWFQVPDGQACVQLYPLRYTSGGTVVSMPHYLYDPPGTADVVATTVYFGTLSSGCNATGSVMAHPYTGGTFLPDGTVNAYRSQVVMTGDGWHTPYLYGMHAEWPAGMGTTWAGSCDVTGYVNGDPAITLSVPESPSGVTLKMVLADPVDLGSVAPMPDTVYNRPVKLEGSWQSGTVSGTALIFQGRNQPPKNFAAPSDDATRVEYEARDMWYVLENYIFTDPLVLDGVDVGTAVATLVQAAGFTSDQCDIGTVDWRVSSDDAPADGQWRNIVKAGDSAAKWIEQLHRDYAPDWYMGFKPGTAGPVFYFHSTEELGTVPSGTVWTTSAESGGTISAHARSYSQQRQRPLANEVIVEGLQPKTNTRLVARAYDVESFVPETDGTARPTNWIGEQRVMIYQNPTITTLDGATRVAAGLLERLCNRPTLAEVETDMMFSASGLPLWRGDVISVGGAPYRIQAFETQFAHEGSMTVWQTSAGTATTWRPTRYVLEAL